MSPGAGSAQLVVSVSEPFPFTLLHLSQENVILHKNHDLTQDQLAGLSFPGEINKE